MEKYCTKCGKSKSLDKFSKDKRNKNGLRGQCKTCDNKDSEKYRQTHKTEITNQRKKSRKTIKGYLSCQFSLINCQYNNTNNPAYRCYGKRGIKNKFESFNEFYHHIVDVLGYNTYKKIKGLEIERINNDGHFAAGNITVVTRSQNCMNRNRLTGCTSKYKGVCWDKRTKNWQAYIQKDGVFIYGGRFNSEEDAAQKYDELAEKIFGEYANTNKKMGLLN